MSAFLKPISPPQATKILKASPALPADTITLTHDQRHRRRIALTSDNGISFLLALDEATLLRDGDLLQLNDGRILHVKAKPEPLMQVRASDAYHLTRLAWHIGNRHLEADISAARILLRRDHVIADMLLRLGATVEEVVAPFNPEGGAYSGHSHGHSHGH